MALEYEGKNVARARRLRENMTPQERKLWYCFLRGYPVRFLRQRPVGSYILDFYCPAAKLAVELDGGQHYEERGMRRDMRRDEEIGRLGIRTLRFSNCDMERRFEEVKAEIDRTVRDRKG